MNIYIISKEPINSYNLSKCSFKSFYDSDTIMYCYVLDDVDLVDSSDYYLDELMKDQLQNALEMNLDFPEEKFEFKISLIKITRVKDNNSDSDNSDDIIDIDSDISYDNIIKDHKPIQNFINRTTSEMSDYNDIKSTYFNANTTTKKYAFCADTRKRHITTINGYGYLNDVTIYV